LLSEGISSIGRFEYSIPITGSDQVPEALARESSSRTRARNISRPGFASIASSASLPGSSAAPAEVTSDRQRICAAIALRPVGVALVFIIGS
jgi:hypothetical protein